MGIFMVKVQLRIPPWIASMLKVAGTDWSIVEMEIEEGTTVGKLLADIAIGNTDFRKGVFDSDTEQVNNLINVILNDTLIQSSTAKTLKLNDGDTLMLLPIYAGG